MRPSKTQPRESKKKKGKESLTILDVSYLCVCVLWIVSQVGRRRIVKTRIVLRLENCVTWEGI